MGENALAWIVLIVDIIRLLFCLVFFVSGIGFICNYIQQKCKKTAKAKDSAKKSKKELIFLIYAIIVLVLFEATYIYFGSRLMKQKLILFTILFPFWAPIVKDIYNEFPDVIKLIKESGNKEMSFLEKRRILRIGFMAFFVDCLNYTEKIIVKVAEIKQHFMHDLLLTIVVVTAILIYLFLIIILSPIATDYVISFIRLIYRKSKAEKLKEKYWRFLEKKKLQKTKFLLIWLLDKSENCFFVFKLLIYLFIPLGVTIDILIFAFSLVKEIVKMTFKHLLLFVGYIAITFVKMLKKIAHLSEKRMIGIFLRIAPIISLLIVVTINRYTRIFLYNEESTAILEFVASTIIIPIVFEWIYSANNKRNERITADNAETSKE